jgi:hypothetical protein
MELWVEAGLYLSVDKSMGIGTLTVGSVEPSIFDLR